MSRVGFTGEMKRRWGFDEILDVNIGGVLQANSLEITRPSKVDGKH
jgi:hypothetical protein